MINIGIVVVTYNRLECLKKNLEMLKNITVPENYRITYVIVNNNSDDGTKEYLQNYRTKENYRIINLEENTGGSGGFYTGVKWCAKNDMNYIWGMDDDAYPEKNSLLAIIELINKYGDKYCYWSNCNKDKEFSCEVKEVQSWMFVGFFISRRIIEKVGLPKSDYFIYHDDSEYAYRIIKSGFKILKCRDSVIEHKDGISNYYSGKSFLGREIRNYSQLSDWKRYYDVRNMILMYSINDLNFWKTLVDFCPKTLIAARVYNPQQLKVIRKAIFHGIMRKSGIYMRP